MSKLSFRARALDATKSMPVYKAEEIPDLPDFAAINRAVPQMPTGMEKEEETEHHLQRALSAQQVYGTAEALTIPVPEIDDVDEQYNRLYGIGAKGYKPPKAYIHVQPWGMDQEIPDYDMDSGDESWLNKQSKKLEVTPLKFETMMDRLEKGSGQTVMTLQEAKALLKEDDDLIIAVYDYWLNKRLRYQHPLIPAVRTEKRDGSTTNNPYVAFRRRTEKMQTRKNRKNDEASYERMLKLKRDLNKALTILELMKRREKSKKEMLKLTIEISEKRYQMEDWDGKSYGEALAKRHTLPPTYIQPILQQCASWGQREELTYTKKTKREYNKKRRHKQSSTSGSTAAANSTREARVPQYNEVDVLTQQDLYSSEDEIMSPPMSASDHEMDDDPDGAYAFRRKPGVFYHAPINNGLGNWPWHGPEEGGIGDSRFRYSLASVSHPRRRCIGYVRRRTGRGGRALLDRALTEWDDYIKEVDFGPEAEESGWGSEYRSHVAKNHIHHFRPKSPTEEEEEQQRLLGLAGDQRLSPSLSTSEFNVESFQNHQEQLLAMQRRQQQQQQEQLLLHDGLSATIDVGGGDGMNPSATSSTLLPSAGGVNGAAAASQAKLTLDSASAAFAASAVHNSATELIIKSSVSTPAITCSTVATSTSFSLSGATILTNASSLPSSLSSLPIVSSNHAATAASSSNAPRVFVTSGAASGNPLAAVIDNIIAQKPTSRSASPAVKPVAVQQNGPTLIDASKVTNVFSTSPAANVLQLNYPLSSSSSSSSSTTSHLLHRPQQAPSTVIHTPTTFVLTTVGGNGSSTTASLLASVAKPQQTSTAVFTKLAAAAAVGKSAMPAVGSNNTGGNNAASSQQQSLIKENHEQGSNNLLKDKVMAMEVT